MQADPIEICRPALNPLSRAIAIAMLVSLLGTPSMAPAQAQVECVFPAVVGTEAELISAIECFNSQPAGEYLITLDADIPLSASPPPLQNGAGASLIIDGAGHVVDGQGIQGTRPFHAIGTAVTLFDITVAGGHVTDSVGGAGILVEGGTLVVDRSTIRDNDHRAFGAPSPGGGGGIRNLHGTLTVRNSTIADNQALQGDSVGGGGILNHGRLLVEGSLFVGNRLVADLAGAGPEGVGPQNGGGAIENGLDVFDAGASGVQSITMKVVNSTFVGNSSNTWGGAISNRAALPSGPETSSVAVAAVYNSSFTGNSADFDDGGGAIHSNKPPFDGDGVLRVSNSIFADNPSGGDCAGCTLGPGNLIGVDPLLGPLQDNGGHTETRAILDGSPATDTGDLGEIASFPTVACFVIHLTQAFDDVLDHGEGGCDNPDLVTGEVLTDQRGEGFSRLGAGLPDSGAYEIQVPCPSFPASVSNPTGLNTAIGCFNDSTQAGEYVITLTGDIDLNVSTPPIDNPGSGISLRIDGDGHTVNGQGILGVRPFAILDDSVVAIQDLTITGGRTRHGILENCEEDVLVCNGGGIFNAGTLTLTDSVVTANEGLSGGGIYSGVLRFGLSPQDRTDAVLTVHRTTISDNIAARKTGDVAPGGGGIDNRGGSLTVTHSSITGNTGQTGGGILSSSPFFGEVVPTFLKVENTVFAENGDHFAVSQPGGGGIFNRGEGWVTTSSFNGNTTRGLDGGGGILNHGTLTVADSTFHANTAEVPIGGGGGGIRNAGNLTMVNSTLSGNTAGSGGGGGIHSSGGLTVVNSTITGNHAPPNTAVPPVFDAAGGGGIYNQAAATLVNTIMAGNTDEDCSQLGAQFGGVINANHSIFGDASSCVNGTGAGNLDGDPLLGPLQDNGGSTFTHAIDESSPAFNAGDNALAVDGGGQPLETDQRGEGFARISDGTVDLGAFEVQVLPDDTPPLIESAIDGTPGDNGWYVSDVTLSWSVTDEESEITGTVGCDPVTVDADTVGETFTCEATSGGGTASETETIKRDATPPVVEVTGVEDGATYPFEGVPEAGCDTQDATSGVATAAVVTVTGGDPDGSGELTATCDGAVDNAGNSGNVATASFTVDAPTEPPTFQDLRDLTREHVDNRVLRAALNALVTTAQILDSLGLQQAANAALDAYISLVEASTPAQIDPADAAELIALAQSLKT